MLLEAEPEYEGGIANSPGMIPCLISLAGDAHEKTAHAALSALKILAFQFGEIIIKEVCTYEFIIQ